MRLLAGGSPVRRGHDVRSWRRPRAAVTARRRQGSCRRDRRPRSRSREPHYGRARHGRGSWERHHPLSGRNARLRGRYRRRRERRLRRRRRHRCDRAAFVDAGFGRGPVAAQVVDFDLARCVQFRGRSRNLPGHWGVRSRTRFTSICLPPAAPATRATITGPISRVSSPSIRAKALRLQTRCRSLPKGDVQPFIGPTAPGWIMGFFSWRPSRCQGTRAPDITPPGSEMRPIPAC